MEPRLFSLFNDEDKTYLNDLFVIYPCSLCFQESIIITAEHDKDYLIA
jgi:hypothetical protein